MRNYLTIALMILALAGCKSTEPAADTAQTQPTLKADAKAPGQQLGGPNQFAIPKAVIYKTNGDWNAHVYINLDDAGRPNGYPAPTDITANSTPEPLADGFLLDRRGGISPRTVFLKWTWAEYAALAEVPTPAQLLAAVIPDAAVTEICYLDLTLSQAERAISRVNTAIREGNYNKVFSR